MHLIAKNVLVMRYGYSDENNFLLYGRHFYNAADEFLFVRLRRLLQQTYIYTYRTSLVFCTLAFVRIIPK